MYSSEGVLGCISKYITPRPLLEESAQRQSYLINLGLQKNSPALLP